MSRKYTISQPIHIDVNAIRIDEYDVLDDDYIISDETIRNLVSSYEIKDDITLDGKVNCTKNYMNDVRVEIYKHMLLFKRDIHSFITELLYKFKFKYGNKIYDIDNFVEEMNINIYNKIYKQYLDKEITFKDAWENNIRFYLKGGKSLNKLIKKLENEAQFDTISRDLKLFKNNPNIVVELFEQKLKDDSNTDYDFTLLLNQKNTNELNNLNEKKIDEVFRQNYCDVLELLNEEAIKLENNEIFKKFKQEYTSQLNNKFPQVIEKLNETIDNIKKYIFDPSFQADKNYKIASSYLNLKIIQIQNFIKTIKEGKIKLTSPTIDVCYGYYPIVILGSFARGIQNKSSFLLYRMKLGFKINDEEIYKMNKDIQNFVLAYCKKENYKNLENRIPFSNIFGELIDISVSLGDKTRYNELWNATSLNYMLRPIRNIDKIENQLCSRIIYNYPCASLKYQLKDILSIFNFDRPQKLDKRCKRVLEYLKMECLANETPQEFSLYISPELITELKNSASSCKELERLLKLLDNKQNKEYYTVSSDKIKQLFSQEICDKNKIITNMESNKYYDIILEKNSWLRDYEEIIKKINIESFFQFIVGIKFDISNYLNVLNNISPFEKGEIIKKLNIIFELGRIIPLKIVN